MMKVNYAEYIEIISTIHNNFNESLQCNNKEYPTEKLKKQIRFRNSCGHKSDTIKHKVLNTNFYTCSCSFYNSQISYLFELYNDYKSFGLSSLRNIYKDKNYIPSKLFEMLKIIDGFIEQKKREQEAVEKLKRLQQKAKQGIK